MLILSRKIDQKIRIGDDITLTIIDVKGDQVKIGITAPKEVPVYRKEVYLQIQQENEQAMSSDSLSALSDFFKK